MTARAARRALAGAALAAAACQPLPHPFAADAPKPGSPMLALPDAAAVAILPVRGGPPATAEKLAPALAAALQKHDIAASDRAVGIASYRLDGRLQAMPPSGDTEAVVVLWRLHDAAGKPLGSRAERVEATAEEWQRGSGAAIAHLAEVSAEQIAAMLQGRPPAGPTAPAVAKAAAVPGPAETRLAVGPVAGASGDGGKALATAIAALLKKRDLSIVAASRGGADLQLDATVAIDKPQAGKQHVKIVWRVRHSKGGEIGTVTQENDVPAGLLDGPWGDLAYTIALAAEDGIMQLVERGEPHPAGNS